jgi:hypothetical protein
VITQRNAQARNLLESKENKKTKRKKKKEKEIRKTK